MSCPRCDEGMGPYRSPGDRRAKPPTVPRPPNYLSPEDEEKERRRSFREACDYGALVASLAFLTLLGLGMLLEKARPGPGPLEKIKAQESAADAGVKSQGGR